jgi:HD-GYP domain-containing protein (c-di-GMP phosphodiesterase class II)
VSLQHSISPSPSLPTLRIADIERRLESARRDPLSNDDGRLDDVLHELRARFRQLTAVSRRLCADPRVQFAELSPLFVLASESLAVSKLIYAELKRIELGTTSHASCETLLEILELNEEQISRLERELSLLDRMVEDADHLHAALDELRNSRSVAPVRFRKLADRIMCDARNTPRSQIVLPAEGILLREFLSRQSHLTEPAVYAAGIETARLIAAVAAQADAWDDGALPLIMAALLHDCGMLSLSSRYACPADRLAGEFPSTFRRHPSIGAAVAAGIKNSGVDLPYLIAQHHERLDGTGFPSQLTSRYLAQPSRLLAVVSRYVEFCGLPASSAAATATGASPAVAQSAADRLLWESERGKLDEELVMSLLASLGVLPKQRPADDQPDQTSATLDEQNTRHLRRDDPADAHDEPHRVSTGPKRDYDALEGAYNPAAALRRRRRRT